jgi:hypothetical protein
MGRWSSFLAGCAFGALAVHGSMNYYLVRSSNGLQWVRKMAPKAELPLVDTRAFTAKDWRRRPDLVAAIMQANRTNNAVQSRLEPVHRWMDQAVQHPAVPAVVSIQAPRKP